MIEVADKWNLWKYPADVYCITTNGIRNGAGHLVMGAGLAKQAATKYPALPILLGWWLESYGNTPCYVPSAGIVSLPTKHNWTDPSDLELIVQSATAIALLARLHRWSIVASVRPGCGLGNLKWNDVKPILEKVWDDRFFIVDNN